MENGTTDTKLDLKDTRTNAAIQAIVNQRDMYSNRAIELEMALAEAKFKIEELEDAAKAAKPVKTSSKDKSVELS